MKGRWIALTLLSLSQGETIILTDEIMEACTKGNVQSLRQIDPKVLIQGRSVQGETCLHVAGIYGQASVTLYVLEQKGADPNIRSTFSGGLRMPPLSWNVYGGHIETVQILIEKGADVNLDFDDGEGRKITVLDVVNGILDGTDKDAAHLQNYVRIQSLLLQHGAKTFADSIREL